MPGSTMRPLFAWFLSGPLICWSEPDVRKRLVRLMLGRRIGVRNNARHPSQPREQDSWMLKVASVSAFRRSER